MAITDLTPEEQRELRSYYQRLTAQEFTPKPDATGTAKVPGIPSAPTIGARPYTQAEKNLDMPSNTMAFRAAPEEIKENQEQMRSAVSIGERPLRLDEKAASPVAGFLQGVVGDIPKGTIAGDYINPLKDTPGFKAGEIGGELSKFIPATSASRAITGGKLAGSLLGRSLEGGLAGGIEESGNQLLKFIGGEETDVSQIPKSAAEFAAFDAALGGVGNVVKKAKPVVEKAVESVPQGVKTGVKRTAQAAAVGGTALGLTSDNETVQNTTLAALPFVAAAVTKKGKNFEKFNEKGGGKKPPKQEVDDIILSQNKPNLNLNNYKIPEENKENIQKALNTIKPEINKLTGEKLSNKEVLNASKTSGVMNTVTTREETKEAAAAVISLKEDIAKLSKSTEPSDIKQLIERLEILKTYETDAGRKLQALSVKVEPGDDYKITVLKDLTKRVKNLDEVIAAAENVDFNNAQEVTEFYRKFVKPKVWDVIDEYRYINLLSSPRTHIINSFSNILQGAVLRPAHKLAHGGLDAVGSLMTGKQREVYTREVKPYYQGYLGSFGEASKKALDALSGKLYVERPDINRIPTNNKFLKTFSIIPRALEAGDVFFRTMIESGEKEALAYRNKRLKGKMTNLEIEDKAKQTAEEYVFRKRPDSRNKSGQGWLLSGIDSGTNAIYNLRRTPGVGKVVGWFVPFVQTPMNIFKQGIENSPVGFFTMIGAKNKKEQAAKALTGSMIFGAAGALAAEGRTTWSAPQGEKDKQAFYAAGLQPYSIKIGDKWYSYSKLGPIAYPLAMAAAIRYQWEDNPKARTREASERIGATLLSIGEFFSDQSYVQGLRDLMDAATLKEYEIKSATANAARQVIPLSALQNWAATVIDPIYRQPSRKSFIEGLKDNVAKGIPGLSFTVDSYKTPGGNDSKREKPLLNALSPVNIRTENQEGKKYYTKRRLESTRRYEEGKIKELIEQGKKPEARILIQKWNKEHPYFKIEKTADDFSYDFKVSEERKKTAIKGLP